MKIAVDTNRVIAALVKSSTTRKILFDRNFEFVTPDCTITEIQEHKEELKAKTNLNDDEFDILLTLVFENIAIIPKSSYEIYLDECKKDISDADDVPVLAVAIATKAKAIWAHDPHFKQQKKVKVFTNIDMLKISDKKNID
ncbi:PIN domain-containing protein [Candidatus Woesearchaeota archaeon]|nr:PIN domain-containing protein [Candidatus Woesearchaeota archaeon]